MRSKRFRTHEGLSCLPAFETDARSARSLGGFEMRSFISVMTMITDPDIPIPCKLNSFIAVNTCRMEFRNASNVLVDIAPKIIEGLALNPYYADGIQGSGCPIELFIPSILIVIVCSLPSAAFRYHVLDRRG